MRRVSPYIFPGLVDYNALSATLARIHADKFNGIPPAEILSIVSRLTDIQVEAMKHNDRRPEIVAARDLAYHALRQFRKDLSLGEIAQCVNIDHCHTTVMHAIERVAERRKTDQRYAMLADGIEMVLGIVERKYLKAL
jgi:chromosomal replication initiation ATPase DnaA